MRVPYFVRMCVKIFDCFVLWKIKLKGLDKLFVRVQPTPYDQHSAIVLIC